MNYQAQFYEVPNSSNVRYETNPRIIKDKDSISLTQNEPPVTQCKVCGLVNFNAWALTMHMRRHNNERPAKCSICPASFVNNTELKSHMTKHTNEKRHKCRFCPETFSSNSSRYFHEDKHGILLHKCKYCEEKFKTKVQRRLHHKSHGKEDLTCNYCPKKFANGDYLKLHEENDHGRVIKSLKCFKCKVKFSTKEALTDHKKTHRLVSGPRRAPVNPKSNEVSYFQDSDVKLSSYFFTCGVCSEKFSFHIDLTKHIENNHSDDKDKVYKFKCDVCNKSFDSQVKLRGHKIGHGPKKHKCPQCEYRTARAKDLERHIEARHSNIKAYKCSECGEAFTQYYNFVSHKLKHGEKKFKCTMCDKAYYVKSRLSKHVRSVHNSEKQICDQCGRVYCNMLSLKVHKNYMHKTPPLCLCNKCGKSILVNEVQRHQTMCTGTPNYDSLSLVSNTKLKGPFCLECNITFSVPRYLLEHCKEFHPENVYPCSACQNEYLSPDSAEKHYTRVHGNKERHAQKYNSVFTIEEKRLLRSDNLSSIFHEHYECFACGYSFLFEGELDIHLSLPSCLKPMPYIDCFAKDKYSDINLFSITKVHDNGYQIAETNNFEVKVVPQPTYSEPLGISIIPSINSEVRNNKNTKKINVRSSKNRKSYEFNKANVPNLDMSQIKKDYDTLPDALPTIHEPKNISKVEPIDINLDSETLGSNLGNGIISSKNLMDLLQGKIVNLHGQSFLPLNEVMEHLKQISAISLNSQ